MLNITHTHATTLSSLDIHISLQNTYNLTIWWCPAIHFQVSDFHNRLKEYDIPFLDDILKKNLQKKQ